MGGIVQKVRGEQLVSYVLLHRPLMAGCCCSFSRGREHMLELGYSRVMWESSVLGCFKPLLIQLHQEEPGDGWVLQGGLRTWQSLRSAGFRSGLSPGQVMATCPGSCGVPSVLSRRCFVFQRSLPGRGELHADGQLGAEEAGLPLPDELRQEPARHGHHGSQHICEGERRGLRARSCAPRRGSSAHHAPPCLPVTPPC